MALSPASTSNSQRIVWQAIWALIIRVVTRVYQRLREVIYHVAELEAGKLKGEIEIDEAYFGGRRKSKRGRGVRGKSIVFRLLERDGRVYTKVV